MLTNNNINRLTVHEKTAKRRSPVIWTSTELVTIADLVADLIVNDPITGTLYHLRAVIELLPPDRQRNIGSLDLVPELCKIITETFHYKMSHPMVIEVPAKMPPIDSLLGNLTLREIRDLETAYHERREEELETLRSRVSDIEQIRTSPVNVSVAVTTTSSPVKYTPPTKVWSVGLDGFSSGQIEEIKRRTHHHKERLDLIPRAILGHKDQFKPFPSAVEAIIVFEKRIDRSHLKKQLNGLQSDRLKIGWASGLNEAVDMILNLVINRPLDYRG